jgi:prepilin-type N-terminal cleavage/methylation domain-containing protein/prepilin-type processing-associated H-X9-DG protein
MKNHLPNQGFPIGNIATYRKRTGFTLVELLVVIVIVAVLCTLAFLGTMKTREKARGVACASNLRQIGVAMIAYAADNNGQLPPLEDRTAAGDKLKGIWPKIVSDGGHLERVIDKNGVLGCGAGVWACPGCTIVQTNYNGYGAVEGTVLKVKKASVPDSGSLRLAQIEDPARTWLVGDTANSSSDLRTGWYAIWANPSKWSGGHTPAARHGGKVNVCMVDGHIEALTMKQLKEGKYTMFP